MIDSCKRWGGWTLAAAEEERAVGADGGSRMLSKGHSNEYYCYKLQTGARP